MNRLLVLLGSIVFVLVITIMHYSLVNASDNTTSLHRHSESMTFKMLSSVPSGWHDSIREAALSWTERTVVSITESSNSVNYIRYQDYPDWLLDDCDPDNSAGCTDFGYIGDHVQWADIYFNGGVSFGTNTFNCTLNYPDVQETAAHEFGHAAGWLDHSFQPPDVMTGYTDGCWRIPTDHDVESMNAQYANHP